MKFTMLIVGPRLSHFFRFCCCFVIRARGRVCFWIDPVDFSIWRKARLINSLTGSDRLPPHQPHLNVTSAPPQPHAIYPRGTSYVTAPCQVLRSVVLVFPYGRLRWYFFFKTPPPLQFASPQQSEYLNLRSMFLSQRSNRKASGIFGHQVHPMLSMIDFALLAIVFSAVL